MSFSFIDFESTDLPYRQTIVEKEIGIVDEYTLSEIKIPLKLISAEINDELISPFPSEDNQFFFLDANEPEIW